jgi:two-component sensor histidine kinase
MTGYTRDQVQARELTWRGMTPPEWMAASKEQARRLAATGRIGPYEKEYLLKDGSRRWMLFAGRDLRDGTISEYCIDITERKRSEELLRQSLREKEELLKEVHHRVKNNLQVITSLLNLQARQIEDEKTLALFEVARNRVQSIASIHELLYRSGSFAAVELGPYVEKLVADVVRLYSAAERIRVEVDAGGAHLELQRAVPFGLLLNELVSNVCKHAFPEGRRGRIAVEVARVGDEIVLTVADDGIGLPEGFDSNRASIGIFLVHRLAQQLEATVEFRSAGGTTVRVRFAAAAADRRENGR